MIRWFRLSRRGWIIAAVAFLLALIGSFPLRAAFALFGLGDMGVAARSLRGPVWWGAAEDLQVGDFRLGTVDVMLAPLPLLVGRVRMDISRDKGLPTDIAGAISVGIASRGIEDVTGTIPAGRTFAPLPVTALTMQDVSIAFAGDRCVSAEGRVQAMVSGGLAGVNLANGLSGQVRCEGADLAVTLVSQSGVERIDLRVGGTGRFSASMTLGPGDPASAASSAAAGFQTVGDKRVLRVQGTL